jgi:[acyl-carrier-protein] S-malonyltransferase
MAASNPIFLLISSKVSFLMSQTACVFPGQGSQSVGMLSDLVPQYSLVSELFFEASEVVGYDLWHLIQQGPQDKLNQTEHTQVAMLTADVVIYELLQQQGLPKPQMMAGHSLGEYAALVAARALSFKDAVGLVVQRARIMQAAVPIGQGGMAAVIGLSDEEVQALCEQASTPMHQVSPANYNAIGQVVVAGHMHAVDELLQLSEAAGARMAKKIPVSVPCHCMLLKEASEEFALSLAKVEFKTPQIKVVSNVDLSIYSSADHIREKLKQQLYSPVRWVGTIVLFHTQGIERVIECGPGRVLSGLIKRIEKSLSVSSVYDRLSLEEITD